MTPPKHAPVADAAFRILFSLIFLVAGAGHLLQPDKIIGRLVQAPMAHLAMVWAPPDALVFLAGVALVLGGSALFVGYRTRLAAALLIGVLVPITITVQVGSGDLGPLFKNIALLGGLIFFATHGATAWSLDALLKPAAAPSVHTR